MANDSSNVGVMKGDATGYAFRAPKGTALITDPKTRTVADPYKGLGYINSDGIVNSFSSDTEDEPDMNGTTVVTLKTSYAETFKFTLMEKNEEAFKTFFGDSNVITDATSKIRTISHNSNFDALNVYLFRCISGETSTEYEYTDVSIPLGKVTERGDITISGTGLFMMEITVSCQPDAKGNTAYMTTATVTKA